MTVTDDGAGGAQPGARAAGWPGCSSGFRRSTGGSTCDSPPGGPTIVTIELPRHA